MYVPYGGGGYSPSTIYSQAPSYQPQLDGAAYILSPPQLPSHQLQPAPRPVYATQSPTMNMYTSPNDMYSSPPNSYGIPAYAPPAEHSYTPQLRPPQGLAAIDYAAASSGGVAGIAPRAPQPAPGQPSQWTGAQASVSQPSTQTGPGQLPVALTQAALDPEDEDPNRLPTFVKVRGLPAEHDPRIARRPKPKKRAPGICCA